MKTMNPFAFSDTNKRYHTYNYALRQRFSGKICKISLNLGLSCPNRDGKIGIGGCTYCSAAKSGDFAGDQLLSLQEQFAQMRAVLFRKWKPAGYIPYFQAGTNTYAPIEFLRTAFYEVLSWENCVGLSIATRADCISPETEILLAELNEKTYLTVELGLQTVHDSTATRIHRGHTYAQFLEAYRRLQARGIAVCVHIINGLPGETHTMMLQTVQELAVLSPHAIKIHLLHILQGTPLAQEYAQRAFFAMTLQEYVRIVCDQLELLPPETIVERLTGDGASQDLIAPLWSQKKKIVMNEIDKELVRRGSYQGSARTT